MQITKILEFYSKCEKKLGERVLGMVGIRMMQRQRDQESVSVSVLICLPKSVCAYVCVYVCVGVSYLCK